ncbi:hypothetical protein J7382_03695 [Shimia sp. R11_0]|uniref:hypothetical protein n=1 Tax=Shimia sp. R11_0 TaxID=2821096 RepID=UPI001AD97B1A|nr:hypothetical protein [Shimia sp. R11_0]MBO9476632.1 hypothetical protein [Shimia sp. R11_0]
MGVAALVVLVGAALGGAAFFGAVVLALAGVAFLGALSGAAGAAGAAGFVTVASAVAVFAVVGVAGVSTFTAFVCVALGLEGDLGAVLVLVAVVLVAVVLNTGSLAAGLAVTFEAGAGGFGADLLVVFVVVVRAVLGALLRDLLGAFAAFFAEGLAVLDFLGGDLTGVTGLASTAVAAEDCEEANCGGCVAGSIMERMKARVMAWDVRIWRSTIRDIKRNPLSEAVMELVAIGVIEISLRLCHESGPMTF